MMLVDSPVPALQVNVWRLAPAIVAFAVFVLLLVRLVVQAQRRRPVTGAEGLVGMSGRAESDLRPEGWVLVNGECWRAVAGEPVEVGATVSVEAVDGLSLRVRKGA
jgi:membrane-bound serine protease (ClpP class)